MKLHTMAGAIAIVATSDAMNKIHDGVIEKNRKSLVKHCSMNFLAYAKLDDQFNNLSHNEKIQVQNMYLNMFSVIEG